MKPVRPLFARLSTKANTNTNASNFSKPQSFGAARAQAMEQRLEKARTERQKLARAQYAAPDPSNKAIEQKGYALDAKINRLKAEDSSDDVY